MKKFANFDKVSHAWAHQTHTDGQASSLYFEREKIFSFGPHWELARITKVAGIDEPAYLVNSSTASSHTGRHWCKVAYAIPRMSPTAFIRYRGVSWNGNWKGGVLDYSHNTLAEMEIECRNAVFSAKRAIKEYSFDNHVNEIRRVINEAIVMALVHGEFKQCDLAPVISSVLKRCEMLDKEQLARTIFTPRENPDAVPVGLIKKIVDGIIESAVDQFFPDMADVNQKKFTLTPEQHEAREKAREKARMRREKYEGREGELWLEWVEAQMKDGHFAPVPQKLKAYVNRMNKTWGAAMNYAIIKNGVCRTNRGVDMSVDLALAVVQAYPDNLPERLTHFDIRLANPDNSLIIGCHKFNPKVVELFRKTYCE